MHGASLEKRIRESLSLSWKEGIPAAIMLQIADAYITPFALFLGAAAQQIGFLVAFPNLLASFVQLFAVSGVRWAGSRLKFIVSMAAAQALLLVPMAVLSLLPPGHKVELLIAFVILFRMFSSLIVGAWGSLMSDYLPPEKRGKYFGFRLQVTAAAGVLGVAFSGAWLYGMKNISPAFGFFMLFLFISLCRLFSSALLARMEDLPFHHDSREDFTFLMFIRRFRKSNFVKFTLYVSSVVFATQVASPYFSVYMLRDLGFSYFQYTVIVIASVVTGFFSYRVWGRHADVVGNAKILKTVSLLIPLIPFLWMPSGNFYYLIFVEMYSGFVWAGFNLCASNFILDAVSPAKRVRCISYFNVINGSAIFAGASLGGFLAGRLPAVWGFRLLTLFFISGALRFFAHAFLSKRFREVRQSARNVSSLQLFFSMAGIKPLSGVKEE